MVSNNNILKFVLSVTRCKRFHCITLEFQIIWVANVVSAVVTAVKYLYHYLNSSLILKLIQSCETSLCIHSAPVHAKYCLKVNGYNLLLIDFLLPLLRCTVC